MNSIQKQAERIDTKIGFNLLPNKTVEIVEEINGLKKTKLITVSQLINIIDSSYTNSFDAEDDNKKLKVMNKTEVLPHSDTVSTVKVMTYEGNKKDIYLLRKDIPTTIDLMGSLFHDVKMPRLLFIIRLNNNSITRARVFAIKDRKITEDTKLYRFPLSNANYNGSICFGSIDRPSYNDVASSFSFPDYFLSVKMNMDNYVNANTSGLSVRPFLEKLTEDKEFNLDFLNPTDYIFGQV